jgi:hypothetical protein
MHLHKFVTDHETPKILRRKRGPQVYLTRKEEKK